jgi:hypothetical protein
MTGTVHITRSPKVEDVNIATPRKSKDGKTFWTTIGTAWFNDNGGIQLVFDALPIPDGEGRVVANLFEPRERRRQVTRDSRPTPLWTMISLLSEMLADLMNLIIDLLCEGDVGTSIDDALKHLARKAA